MIATHERRRLRSPIFSPLGRALRTAVAAGGRAALGTSATRWLFAARGIEGTPFEYLSRGGLATTVDATGAVVYGLHNLLLHSDEQETAYWERGDLVTATPLTTTTVPDGTRCTLLSISAGTGYSFARRAVAAVAGRSATLSVRVH